MKQCSKPSVIPIYWLVIRDSHHDDPQIPVMIPKFYQIIGYSNPLQHPLFWWSSVPNSLGAGAALAGLSCIKNHGCSGKKKHGNIWLTLANHMEIYGNDGNLMKFKTSGDLDDFPNSNAHYRGIHIAMFEYRHSNPKGPCCPCFWQGWTMLNQWNTQWSRFQWNTTETQTAQHAVAPGSGNIQGDTISSNPSFRRRQKHSEVMGHSSNANDQRLL